ncbi:hypothetical protein LY76DRAFT_218540 [Colletotrichum caudatum]|nr:hypothetical protein LY76DRAFT_218540 [Colletotrichum caudatum]
MRPSPGVSLSLSLAPPRSLSGFPSQAHAHRSIEGARREEENAAWLYLHEYGYTSIRLPESRPIDARPPPIEALVCFRPSPWPVLQAGMRDVAGGATTQQQHTFRSIGKELRANAPPCPALCCRLPVPNSASLGSTAIPCTSWSVPRRGSACDAGEFEEGVHRRKSRSVCRSGRSSSHAGLGTVSPSEDVQTSAPAHVWGTWLAGSQWTIPPTSTTHPPWTPYQTRDTQQVVTSPAWQQPQNARGLALLATSLFCFTCFFCLVRLQIEVAFESRALRWTEPQ